MKDQEEKRQALMDCFESMSIAFQQLEEAKADYKERVEAAYEHYGKSLDFGDDVLLFKPIENLVKAHAKGKTDNFATETKEAGKVLLKVLGMDTSPLLMEVVDNE